MIINPDVNRPEEVATPEECLKVDLGQVVTRIFLYLQQEHPPEGKLILDNPILCFHEKDPCPDEEHFESEEEFEMRSDASTTSETTSTGLRRLSIR